MGQDVLFDGRLHTEPTSKGKIIGGNQNRGSAQSFGNIAIIDTGKGAGFGGGVGAVDSSAADRQLQDFGVEFNSPQEMKQFVKGGFLYDIADYLYAPSNSSLGASKVFLLRAAQTKQATLSSTFTAAFDLVLNTKEEGLVTNGVLVSTKLSKGYAWTITSGVVDTAKFVFNFYRGSYRGVDSAGNLYDGISAADAAENPILITKSIEVANLSELIAWGNANADFLAYFEFDATSDSAGVFETADKTLLAGFNIFAGATETYDAGALDNVLAQIGELDNSFFLSMDAGADAAGVNNVKILAHINNESEFKKFLIIGGGDVGTTFESQSLANAVTLNSRYSTVVHGGIFEPYILNSAIEIKKSAIYKAAMYVGRSAGLLPQQPLTYKDLRIRREQHVLTEAERVKAINSGVVATRSVPTLGNVVNQSINTLQMNDNLLNPDGSSPEFSVERIEAQLNREISNGAKVLFIGGNLATVSGTTIVSYGIGYLQNQIAEAGISDGMLIEFWNVKAVRQGTTWFLTYDFQANTPINKIFSTGTIIDPSLS